MSEIRPTALIYHEAYQFKAGNIVQLSPTVGNPMFAYCLLVITEIKTWGVMGYVQALGKDRQPGGQAYYRAKWDEIEPTKGSAVWVSE